ncbi:MAG: AI-2E family transporter [Nitrososphaerales archaeon]
MEAWPPIARSLAGLALVGFVLLLMHLAAPVLVPVLLAFFLAALALPGFRWLQRRGVKRGLALLLLVVALLAGGMALILLGLSSIRHLQTGLQAYSDQLAVRLDGLAAALAGWGVDLTEVSADAAAAGTAVLGALFGAMANAASSAVVSLVVVAFFLLESPRLLEILRSDAVQKLPVLSQTPKIAATAVQYFGIRTRLNLITGAGVTIVCALLGVAYPLLWGVLAFVLSYIPYIGLFTAMIPPALLALAESGWLAALIVVVTITVLNLTIENILEPGYTGRRLQLSPTVVFLSFFFWAWLLGPVGALLSMPITVMLLLVSSRDESTRWLALIIGREA